MAEKITREKHLIDATGKQPGRLATQVSRLLIGKHKPTYTPNMDAGDFVEVINAANLRFTGKKLEQATHKRHSGYQGGLKVTPMKQVLKENPTEILRHAVSRMLPKNKLRSARLKRLTIKTS